MNKVIFISLLSLFVISTSVQAQNKRGNKRDRVESLRIAYITNNLNLTPEESTVFWPIYNQMKEEVKAVRKEFRSKLKSMNSSDEGEARKMIEIRLDQRQKEVDITRDHMLQLADAISPSKVILLNEVENDFKKELLKEVRNRKR